ncbi:hypothetical protein GGI17_000561 [Coemansia sp. S146]|nr:hypothetical protein GGI17_000561 [Coemansia sp. S146]
MKPPVGATYSLAVAWDFSVRATDTLNSLVATAAHNSIAASERPSSTIVESTHTCTERSYNAESRYNAYPVTVDCGEGDDKYLITCTEWKWICRVRNDYNVDLLDRLSNSQLETLYSAYHALRDWHSGLPLDDGQHMALLRVCFIADKHRSRGELATPTMLLTSMAFRHMDNDDVLYTIPRLVVEYYSEH